MDSCQSMSLANGECGLTCPTPWRIFPDLGWPCLQSESSCYQFVCFAAYFRTDFPLDQAIDVLAVNILVIRVELSLHALGLLFHL